MRAARTRLTAIAVIAATLVGSGTQTASAATLTVCHPSAGTCEYTTIQTAVNSASAGDVISIAAGTYREDVVLNQSVTLQGAGPGRTIVEPATSNPTCGDAADTASLCQDMVGATPTNVFLVQSSNVTISGLTVNGNNTTISSGTTVGGSDIDARNGIIVDFLTGDYGGLTVTHVRVMNVYLRGIFMDSQNAPGGSFSFTYDRVDNVQGSVASIGIFTRFATGTDSHDVVSNTPDAISSNWSYGVQFLNNRITSSNSGIHTDNSGTTGTADLIKGNRISACVPFTGSPDAYAIWVLVPYHSVTITRNTVTGCTVGLAVFGSGSLPPPTIDFNHNRVSGGTGAPDGGTSIGAWVTTYELGFGYTPASATFEHNLISGFNQGFDVQQPNDGSSTPTASAVFSYDAIDGNTTADNGDTGTTVTAADNWWGCTAGPGTSGCDSVSGTTTYIPWLTIVPAT